MMQADDAYAGSESFFKLADAVKDVLGFRFVIPAHQGRAAEHLLAKALVKPGDVVLMNYHFTTSKAHIDLAGGRVQELFGKDALETASSNPFKGNIDLDRMLLEVINGENNSEPRTIMLNPELVIRGSTVRN